MIVTKEFIYDPDQNLTLETSWSDQTLILTFLHQSGAEACTFNLIVQDVEWLIEDLSTWLQSRKKPEVEDGE